MGRQEEKYSTERTRLRNSMGVNRELMEILATEAISVRSLMFKVPYFIYLARRDDPLYNK